MGKHNVVSGILVLIVLLTIAISTFAVVNYSSGLLSWALAFASTDSMAKLSACGITPPTELYKLQYDIPNLLVPGIYAGFPSLMVVIAILMFIAGYYYGNDKEAINTSETTTTTTAPNRRKSGQYSRGRRVEKTRTQKSTKSEVA